jgi:hypothetical protein
MTRSPSLRGMHALSDFGPVDLFYTQAYATHYILRYCSAALECQRYPCSVSITTAIFMILYTKPPSAVCGPMCIRFRCHFNHASNQPSPKETSIPIKTEVEIRPALLWNRYISGPMEQFL